MSLQFRALTQRYFSDFLKLFWRSSGAILQIIDMISTRELYILADGLFQFICRHVMLLAVPAIRNFNFHSQSTESENINNSK